MNGGPSSIYDGDKGFLGVDYRRDPSLVAPSFLAAGENLRFEFGNAETRKGLVKFPWMHIYTNELISPYATVYGAGFFNDPTGVEWMIVATSDGLYRLTPGTVATTLNMEAGETIEEYVYFEQSFNYVTMHRGDDKVPLVMTSIDEGFKYISQQSQVETETDPITTGGSSPTVDIPNSTNATFFQNRLVVPYARDKVAVSELLNYTKFHPIENNFRINQGSEDALTRVYPFNQETLLAFKEQSIYAITGLYGDWYANARLTELTREYGCKAYKTIASVGRDVWFLSDKRGVCSIQQSEDGKMRGLDLPVSEPIQPLIDKIVWPSADLATATWFNNRYYLAVPFEDARTTGPELSGFAQEQPRFGTAEKAYYLPIRLGVKYKYVAAGTESEFGFMRDTPWPNPAKTVRGSSPSAGEEFEIQTNSTTTNLFYVRGTGITGIPGQLYEIHDGVNNAVLIYDHLNQAWSGVDRLPAGTSVRDWVVMKYQGKKRLFFLSDDGYVNLYDDRFYGTVGDMLAYPDGSIDYVDITTKAKTRGFSCGFTGRKRFKVVRVNLKTFNPAFNVKTYTDGASEVATSNSVTVDRTVYDRPWNATPWTASSPGMAYEGLDTMGFEDGNPMGGEARMWNGSDDHATKYRQDYSVVLGQGESLALGDNGVDLDLHQEWSDEYRLNREGRYLQVEIEGTQGRMEIIDIGVAANPGVRDIGRAI